MYNFIVLVLILEILGGIIIDTFAELRSEDEEKKSDMNNYCFICGLYRRDIDKLSVRSDFDEHINKKHNMWDYLFYIAYITDKEATDLTGIESYVANCIEDNNT